MQPDDRPTEPTPDPGAAAGSLDAEAITRAWHHAEPGALVRVLENATSTQDEVRALAETTAGGCLVVASTQSSGRGTRGRGWVQDGHDDVGFSFVVRPHFDPRLLPMLVGAAVRRGLQRALAEVDDSFAPDRVRLKWPNDVLLHGRSGIEDFDQARKTAGILIESCDRGSWIVGIGININRTSLPEQLLETATSLALASGRTFDRSRVLCGVLDELRELTNAAARSAATIEALYEDGLGLIGRTVDLRTKTGVVSGVLERVGADGVRLSGHTFAPGEVDGISSSRG